MVSSFFYLGYVWGCSGTHFYFYHFIDANKIISSKPQTLFHTIRKSKKMAYTSGMLKYRVTIMNKQVATGFGETTSYQPAATVWADVTWKKGQKALNEGALDAQDTVMIRMRYNNIVKRESRLQYGGVTYQIQSFHADKLDNTIQITAQEMVQAAPTYNPSMSEIGGGPRNPQEFGG